MDGTPLQDVSITDLTRQAGVSRRTLEYAFRDNFDVSPAAYIKAMRLRYLNRELLNKNRSVVSVGELCQQHGFHHQGQLAADYLAMFGERPLATLQRL
jgi:AraC family ethanolamine operon transcriptional activator